MFRPYIFLYLCNQNYYNEKTISYTINYNVRICRFCTKSNDK